MGQNVITRTCVAGDVIKLQDGLWFSTKNYLCAPSSGAVRVYLRFCFPSATGVTEMFSRLFFPHSLLHSVSFVITAVLPTQDTLQALRPDGRQLVVRIEPKL